MSAAHDVKAQRCAPACLRNGHCALGGALDTAVSRQVEQPDDMVARRHLASGEHTRIGFDASADARRFDRHSECDRRDVAAARRHADCDGSSVWLLLTPRCSAGRSGQDEERDQHDECRCGGSHGHSMIRDRRSPSAHGIRSGPSASSGRACGPASGWASRLPGRASGHMGETSSFATSPARGVFSRPRYRSPRGKRSPQGGTRERIESSCRPPGTQPPKRAVRHEHRTRAGWPAASAGQAPHQRVVSTVHGAGWVFRPDGSCLWRSRPERL